MLKLLKKRRSIRKYEDKRIEKEKIAQIVQGALLSPSSRGLNPWEFIIVEDRTLLERLSHSKPGSSFLKNAQLGIVVLGNSSRSDVWIEDTSIASAIIQLTVESMGLGSCWIQIRKRNHTEGKTAENYVREILNIPDSINVLSIISIGYPDEIKEAHKEEDLDYEKVHSNSYGKRYDIK